MTVLPPPSPNADRRALPGAWVHDGGADAARRWLEEHLAGSGRPAVMLASLSRLDLVNAAHGRVAGDALLRVAVVHTNLLLLAP